MRLKEISGLTLEHCNRNAEDFREGTRDHDVGQNIDALLRTIRIFLAIYTPRFTPQPTRSLNPDGDLR